MIAIPLVILLMVAIGMGWLGPIDRGKISDLPMMGNRS
jgi:hypothetical protein